jgi:predicted RNA binding protein YcfA (HicA-like mRNA interferase family)
MPTWKELKRFCERDGWERYKVTSDHFFYRKRDENGNVRRVKVSMGTGEIHGHLWQEILKKQLCVSREYFNRIR